jgi:hypothetical protein
MRLLRGCSAPSVRVDAGIEGTCEQCPGQLFLGFLRREQISQYLWERVGIRNTKLAAMSCPSDVSGLLIVDLRLNVSY